MSKDEKNVIAGIDVSGLSLEVQKAIREAAQKAATKVVKKAKAKAALEEAELVKWEGVANAIGKALTEEQKTAIGDGSFRIWFEDGKAKTWRVFKSRNGGNSGARRVKVKIKGEWREYESGQHACDKLGIAVNGGSAPRLLVKKFGQVNVVKV